MDLAEEITVLSPLEPKLRTKLKNVVKTANLATLLYKYGNTVGRIFF